MDERIEKVKNQIYKFPYQKFILVVLIVFISVATNDIRLRYDVFIRKNFEFQLLIVGILAFVAFSNDEQTTFMTKITATILVLVVFYIFALPVPKKNLEDDQSIYSHLFESQPQDK